MKQKKKEKEEELRKITDIGNRAQKESHRWMGVMIAMYLGITVYMMLTMGVIRLDSDMIQMFKGAKVV